MGMTYQSNAVAVYLRTLYNDSGGDTEKPLGLMSQLDKEGKFFADYGVNAFADHDEDDPIYWTVFGGSREKCFDIQKKYREAFPNGSKIQVLLESEPMEIEFDSGDMITIG